MNERLHTIQQQACLLVVERGYNGFTMDELAEAVGVSRRTLFNYVPDKSSAVLGRFDPEDHECIAEFRESRPTGRLVPDLAHALDRFLEDAGEPFTSVEHHRLIEQAMASDLKVAQLAMERFVHLAELLTTLICEREHWPAGDLRAKSISSTFLALIKLSLDEFTARGAQTDFRTIFHEVLDAAQSVRIMP